PPYHHLGRTRAGLARPPPQPAPGSRRRGRGGVPDPPPLMHQRGGTCDAHRRVTRTSAFLARGVRRATSGRPPTAWCQAGPACLPQVTTPVTPGGDLPRSTVLDEHGGARVPAASGGDVACPHDVALA